MSGACRPRRPALGAAGGRCRIALLRRVLGLSPPAPRRPPPPRVQARFDLDAASASPFPADWLTVPDRAQRTGLRVAGPPPRCTLGRSACDDLRLLGELDGFDLEPRLALRFTGAIDLGSVTARSVFLIRLVAGPAEVTG